MPPDAAKLVSAASLAARLKLSKSAVWSLAKRRILPRLPGRGSFYNWEHVCLILAKLTLWELQYGKPRLVGSEILTGPELAGLLGFTLSKIHALTRRRFIPSIRIGGATRYDLRSVEYALGNLISVRECGRRLGLSRWQIDSLSGPGRTIPVIRLGKRCLRYHWPSVQDALAKASAAATVLKIA